MKKAFQWIDTRLVDPAKGQISIRNKYQFISLDGFEGSWTLSENGKIIASGKLDMPNVAPLSEATATIPYRIDKPKPDTEYFLRVSYRLKDRTLWADKGFEIACEQFKLPINTVSALITPSVSPLKIAKDAQSVTISGHNFSLAFDKQSGFLTQLVKDGTNLLAADGGPKLHLWRSAHRNDDMWAFRQWEKYGVDSLKYSLVSFDIKPVDKNSVNVVSVVKAEGKEGFGALHTTAYLVKGDGTVTVTNKIEFVGTRINLARIGVRFLLDKRLDNVTYFGRGPVENYSDRKSAQDVGQYKLDVNNQYEYEKPMDRGNHEDVRWADMSGSSMPSFSFQADKNLMQFSALPHADEQMQNVEYKIDLPKSQATVFTLAAKTLGVGSNGCGPKPLDKYLVWSDNTEFTYVIDLSQIHE